MTDMENWSDDQINRAKFKVIQRICDENSFPYPVELVNYLARQQNS